MPEALTCATASIYRKKLDFMLGHGLFYEYEIWNHNGVNDALLPINPRNIQTEALKLGTYISFKWKTDFNLDFDISVYHRKVNSMK